MSQPDRVIARAPQFDPHPEGSFAMVCVDCIDLGTRLKQFPGAPEYLAETVILVYQSGEKNREGRLHEVSCEFTVSMGKKARLRAHLEAWRGKSYTEEQAREVDISNLVGQPAFVYVEHKESAAGRTYANIKTIMPLPKGMVAPTLPAWERPAFYAERKATYAAEVAAYKAKIGVPVGLDEVPPGLAGEHGDDDDLPF